MIDQAHLTNSEYFNLYGTLDNKRIDDLLYAEECAPDLKGVIIDAQEASAMTIAEDFAGDVIDELANLMKNLRGRNRVVLGSLIEKLQMEIQSEVHSGEYAQEKLDSIIKSCS